MRPILESRGLEVPNVKYESYPGIADGIIIRQFPQQGSPVSSRDPITLVVSRQVPFGAPQMPPEIPEEAVTP